MGDTQARRIRFRRREDYQPEDRNYDVRTQDKPRGRWQEAGRVVGLGAPPVQWAALGTEADAWTNWMPTRQAAAEEMLDGHTFRTRQDEAYRAKWQARHESRGEELEA
jgi:hypothetical protein